MSISHFGDRILNNVLWIFVISFAIIQIATQISKFSAFNSLIHRLQNTPLPPCSELFPQDFLYLTDQQRTTISGFFLMAGCIDHAEKVLPNNDENIFRKEFFAYYTGLIAWENNNPEKAFIAWKKGKGINYKLLRQAREIKENNVNESIPYYDASIKSSSNFRDLAEIITYFTEDLRSEIDPEAFTNHLLNLVNYFGDNTSIGYRLRGQANQRKGDYNSAIQLLSLAIEGGYNDSETWFYLGEAAWQLGELDLAENAFKKMIGSPNQITWRKPWYFYRLGKYYIDLDRPTEGLSLVLTAHRESKYYTIPDAIAIAYAQLGQLDMALTYCKLARSQAGPEASLNCEIK